MEFKSHFFLIVLITALFFFPGNSFPLSRYRGYCDEEKLPTNEKFSYIRVAKNYFHITCSDPEKEMTSSTYHVKNGYYVIIRCPWKSWYVTNSNGYNDYFESITLYDLKCTSDKENDSCLSLKIPSDKNLTFVGKKKEKKFRISCLGDKKLETSDFNLKNDAFLDIYCKKDRFLYGNKAFIRDRDNLEMEINERMILSLSCIENEETETKMDVRPRCSESQIPYSKDLSFTPIVEDYLKMVCDGGKTMKSRNYMVVDHTFIEVFCDEMGQWRIWDKEEDSAAFNSNVFEDIQCLGNEERDYCTEIDYNDDDDQKTYINTAISSYRTLTFDVACRKENNVIAFKKTNGNTNEENEILLFYKMTCGDEAWKIDRDTPFSNTKDTFVCYPKQCPVGDLFRDEWKLTQNPENSEIYIHIRCKNSEHRISVYERAIKKISDSYVEIKCMDNVWKILNGDDEYVEFDEKKKKLVYCMSTIYNTCGVSELPDNGFWKYTEKEKDSGNYVHIGCKNPKESIVTDDERWQISRNSDNDSWVELKCERGYWSIADKEGAWILFNWDVKKHIKCASGAGTSGKGESGAYKRALSSLLWLLILAF